MATDQEFRDLEAVVATLRRDLRESQDTINLWRQNGMGHLDSGSGKWRFGGNLMQLNNYGMQVAAPSNNVAITWVPELTGGNPEDVFTTTARLAGRADDVTPTSTIKMEASVSGGTGQAEVQAEDGVATFSVSLDAGTAGDANFIIKHGGAYTRGLAWNGSLHINGVVTPAALTANEDNYAPTDGGMNMVWRLSSDASRNITGMQQSDPGGLGPPLRLIFNVGAFDIVLKDEDAGSDAANRFALDGDITLAPDTGAVLWYDTITERWRCAGRYSAGGGAGDVATDTLWDALGDLAVGTGANTANNLPVGTDGYVLTADSTDLSFGIKWAPAAGGPGGSTSIARTLMLMGA